MTRARTRKRRLADPRRARLGRVLSLVGYFALLALIVNRFTWLAPPETVPRALPLAALALPLLVPLRGLLHGRRTTHLWTSLLALPYFALGIDGAFNAAPGQAWLGAASALCTLVLFVGCLLYVRYTASGPPRTEALAERAAEARLRVKETGTETAERSPRR